MEEPSEYFQVRVLHLTKDQTKLFNKPNQGLTIYHPEDFKPYLTHFSEKNKDCMSIITELLHQADKHLSTFTDSFYVTQRGEPKTMLVETHIFIFHRVKGGMEL